jgi:hypothetical protein
MLRALVLSVYLTVSSCRALKCKYIRRGPRLSLDAQLHSQHVTECLTLCNHSKYQYLSGYERSWDSPRLLYIGGDYSSKPLSCSTSFSGRADMVCPINWPSSKDQPIQSAPPVCILIVLCGYHYGEEHAGRSHLRLHGLMKLSPG